MELIFLIAIGFAFKSAFDHVRTRMGESRAASMKQVAKTFRKGEVPKHKLKAASRRHDLGYIAREIGRGLPVTRRGWQAGWIAHRTAAEQHRARLEEAKTTHADVQASVLAGLPDHKARQAEAKKRRDEILAQLKGQPAEAKGSRKAVREAADELARKRAEKQAGQQQDAEVPPLPSDTVISPEPVCRVCTKPGTAADPLVPAGIGVVHRSHNERGEEILTAARAASQPEPGPYAPTRRLDGKPETGADRKFLDLRESGYDGPIDQDGNAAPDEESDASRSPQPIPPSPASEGDAMTTGTAETTYDQQIAAANEVISSAEAEIADLQRRRLAQQVEALGSLGLDSGSLSRAAEIDDALKAQEKAAQQVLDAAQAFRDGLVRDHGNVNEAHQAAPQGGAERAFYQG